MGYEGITDKSSISFIRCRPLTAVLVKSWKISLVLEFELNLENSQNSIHYTRTDYSVINAVYHQRYGVIKDL